MINFNLGLTLESLKTIFRMVLDISIMWMLLYYAIKIVRTNSRTIQIFKGIALILVVNGAAKFLGLETVIWLSDQFLNWGFLAIIVVFQPEIRSVLEKLGKSNVFSRISTLTGNEKEKLVDELVTATTLLARNQTGALISLEQGHALNDFIKTGTPINSIVTAELITSIFVTSTPLHDGAVIIQGDRIACASAYFPPTNMDLPSRYGARHRAAIGISEITDAVTIVVSEETGAISITDGGKILTVDRKQLREYLIRVICGEETEVKSVKSAAVIPSIIIEREAPQDIPAQEYIVENSENKPEVQAKKDPMLDTAILSKLAIKRHATEEEQKDFVDGSEEKIEEVVLPLKVKVKEKKKFNFFKSKKKENTMNSEERAYQALDEEAASIKLPKKKENLSPLYSVDETNNQPSKENRDKMNENRNYEVKETVVLESIPTLDIEQEIQALNQEEDVVKASTNKLIFNAENFESDKVATNRSNDFFSTASNVRVMGIDEVEIKATTKILTGQDITNSSVDTMKQGDSWSSQHKDGTMIHPIHESELEVINNMGYIQPKKSDARPAFKVDFTDKGDTANIQMTGEIKRPIDFENTALRKNIEDLIDIEGSLEDQFAMLDTMSIQKSKITEVLDIKPANVNAGGEHND